MSGTSRKAYRACLKCHFVQSAVEFRAQGCPNCEDTLQMQGNPDRVSECTTSIFDGTIAMMQPEKSWVARYQKLGGKVPGLYAVRVTGTLPEE